MMLVEQRGGVGVLDHRCSGGLSTPEQAHSIKNKSFLRKQNQNYYKQLTTIIFFTLRIFIKSFAGVAQSGTAWDC
jgi:hypothetical protein